MSTNHKTQPAFTEKEANCARDSLFRPADHDEIYARQKLLSIYAIANPFVS